MIHEICLDGRIVKTDYSSFIKNNVVDDFGTSNSMVFRPLPIFFCCGYIIVTFAFLGRCNR